MLKCLAAFPVTESGDVEVRQMDLLDRFAFFASPKASVFEIKLSLLLSESKVRAGLHQNVGHVKKLLRKKHHPGRNQGDGRYERLSANTSLESRRPTRTAVVHFSPLGTSIPGTTWIPPGFRC